MNPTLLAAFINAQTALLLVELEGMKAYDRRHPHEAYDEQAYIMLYDRYAPILGEDAFRKRMQEATDTQEENNR
jgi:hypothetical protein